MAGEIASAFIAILPTMRGFGTQMVAQAGPQVQAASRQLGERSGVALGAALGGSASKAAVPAIASVNSAIVSAQRSSGFWLTEMGQMAVKNVTIYGSMYAAIQGVQAGLSSAFDAMVGFNAQLEQAQIGFTTLLKSSAAANDEMAWIKDFAVKSPFRYGDLVQYSQRLIAMGFDANESRKVLIAAGDAASALGSGADGINRINLALGQMWTKGKVQSQEMLQLTEAGINGWQILADAYGTTVDQVQDRVTAGLIKAQDAVPALVAGMESEFGGLMDKQSATFEGVWSNIQDSIQQKLATAGEPLFDQLKTDAQEFLDALDDPETQKILDGIGSGLANVASGLADVASMAASAFKDALPFLEGVWSNAKSSLPVLLGVAAAFVAIRKAQAGGLGVGFFGGLIAESKAAAAAVVAVETPTRAMVAAQKAALVSSINLGTAQHVEAQAASAAEAAAKAATAATTRGTVASQASWAAQRELTAAARDRLAANAQLVASENAVTAATEKAVASQSRLAAVGAGLRKFAGIGQAIGLIGLSASITAAGDASASAEQKVGDLAGAFGSGALTGAAFGIALGPVAAGVGAAIGGVVGLTAALVNLQQAQNAASNDTSATVTALEQVGVSADTATSLISNLSAAQIESLGGSQALVDAVQHGGTAYEQLVAKLTDAQQAYEATKAAVEASKDANGQYTESSQALIAQLSEQYSLAQAASAAVAGLAQAASESAYQQFLAVEASNAATGSYGAQAEAAYQAAAAIGTIPLPLLQTGVAAEGASGMVGYLLNALTGLPVNTPINFSTNATDIIAQIATLKTAIKSMAASQADDPWAEMQLAQQITDLQSQLKKSLTTSVSMPTLTLPAGSAKKAGASATQAAAAAAAQQLKQDRQAQLQFADAFGTLMQSALEGNFDQYRDKLADEITSLTRDGYQAAADTLQRLSGTLTQASLDYAALTNKIKAATDAETSLTKRMQDQYQSTVDLITGLGKVTDAQSFDQLTYLLGETTTAATQYQDVLQALKDEGLSDDLWNQLAQAGPQSMGLAQSILAQGQAGVDQLNSLSGNLVDAADSMGDLVSQSMYQQGVDAMQAYIDGLNSQSTALENQLATIANNILNQTAGAITPGNAGYTGITNGTVQTANTYNVNVSADSLEDLQSVQNFINMLNSQATSQLVNAAGTVTS